LNWCSLKLKYAPQDARKPLHLLLIPVNFSGKGILMLPIPWLFTGTAASAISTSGEDGPEDGGGGGGWIGGRFIWRGGSGVVWVTV